MSGLLSKITGLFLGFLAFFKVLSPPAILHPSNNPQAGIPKQVSNVVSKEQATPEQPAIIPTPQKGVPLGDCEVKGSVFKASKVDCDTLKGSWESTSMNTTKPPIEYQNYGWYIHNGQSMQYVNGQWYSTPQQNTPPAPSITSISSPTPNQTPRDLMPDKPIIDSFCDNKGDCVHSQFADPSSSSILYPYPKVHVGETLNFTIKVLGQETAGVEGFILDQDYTGEKKSWSTDLTFTKNFSGKDITTSGYPVYAYIKSQNDNYHRRSNGCNWIDYSCDDSATLLYTVVP